MDFFWLFLVENPVFLDNLVEKTLASGRRFGKEKQIFLFAHLLHYFKYFCTFCAKICEILGEIGGFFDRIWILCPTDA